MLTRIPSPSRLCATVTACLPLAAMLTLAASAPFAQGAVLTYAGSQTDVGSGWRTVTDSKPLDIDADNVFGTDGYYVVNRPIVQPSYVDRIIGLTDTFPGDGGYAMIDDPTNPGVLFTSGTMTPVPGAGLSANLLQFTLNSNAVGRVVRVGLMVDNLDDPGFNAASLTLVQTNGVGATNGPVATTSSIYNDQIPDWIFFDITSAVAGDTFIIQATGGAYNTATLGGVSFDSVLGHPAYALDFNGSNNFVSLSLFSPPSNNYTLGAWVNLRTGGSETGARVAVLSATACGDSIEMLIHSQTSSAADPQYLELGRCDNFTGFLSTNPVPLNAWTYLAVTRDVNNTISYYINGQPAGTFADPNPLANYALGTAVNLGDNSGIRTFNGLLADAQIWDRVLSPEEIQALMNQGPAAAASGLYACYPFAEGSGTNTADFATAAGGSAGALINNPAWVPLLWVTTNADSGPGSLRDAITEAPCGSAILFDDSLAGQTITLTSGELELTTNLTIDASALPGGIIIDGDQNGSVLEVDSGATNVLTALTLTNGAIDEGGAIYNGGTLTVNQCALVGNFAIYGGAVFNGGALTANQCTVAGNGALGMGGGLLTYATELTVNECTVTGNSAGDSGGGIFNYEGTLNVNQCTVTGNSSGGNYFNGNYFGGGGGINNYAGPGTLTNSIVAGNSGEAADIYNQDSLVLGGANIVQSFGGYSSSGSAPIDADPMLAPLGNYGGPTLTMLPLPGSPAIDGCTNGTSFTTDQRGLPRVVGPFADIGAVESGPIPGFAPVVAVTDDVIDGIGSSLSLRAAVLLSPSGSTITFAPNLSGTAITLTNGEILLTNNLTIDASALPAGIIIDGNQNGRVFQVANGATNVLTALTITNGSDYYGGGIYNDGTLTVNQCTFAGNNAFVLGGGIFNHIGTLTVNECTVTENSAADSGGGIFNYVGTLTVNQCTVTGNSASSNYFAGGGGVNNYDGAMTLSDTIVAGNTNPSYANLFGLFSGSANLTDGDPVLGPLGNYGGPTPTMLPLPGSPAIDGCTNGTSFTTDQRGLPRVVGPFADIGAVESGTPIPGFTPVVSVTSDGIYGLGSSLSLRVAVLLSGNGSTITFAPNLSGAAITLTNGEILLANNLTIDASALPGGIIIDGNQNGRVFQVANGATNVLTALTITNGSDYYGGGIYNDGTLTVNQCTFAGNSAFVLGGGLYNNTGTLTVNECTVTENSAADSGGGIFNYVGTLTVNQCTVTGNSSRSNYFAGGGGVNNYDGAMTLSDTIVAGNTNLSYANLFGSFSGSDNLTNGDPVLAPLGNYGGPTPTMRPLPGSPAIDAGGDSATNTFATDQRGLPRLSGLHVDIGAVELQQATVATRRASDITPVTARVNGVVTPNELATIWSFEYGTTTNYNITNAPQPLVAGFCPVAVSNLLGGLSPATRYHYRIFAYDGVSTKVGRDATFATLCVPPSQLQGAMILTNGSFQFTFTNLNNFTFTVFATTNVALPPAQWTSLGSAIETPPGSGQYQFADPQATNYPERFYFVHWP